MKEKEYKYMGVTIEQYVFEYSNGTKRYFYPSFNGNFETTDIRKVCKYIKTCLWMDRQLKELNLI